MATARSTQGRLPLAATGIVGLDDVLLGGLTTNRIYLLEGVPGAGKTTLALQFFMEGVRLGERVLYVTLSESEEELLEVAATHDWSLKGITFRELIPTDAALQSEEQYSVFHSSEIELPETIKSILEEIERIKPARVVIDSLSELRLLAGSPLKYRRQILALKQFFMGQQCTVLLLDDLTSTERDLQVQSIAHGVLALEQLVPEYGAERRRLRVVKFRAKVFRGGYHDYAIRTGGLEVFPRLVAAEHRKEIARERMSGGMPHLDELVGGGLERGTSTLLVGAPGTGKSTLATQFVSAAAQRGQKSALFIFDESPETLLARAEGMGIALRQHVSDGLVSIQSIDPAELSPGEFGHTLRRAVERDQVSMIVIDSLNGYLNAMPEERFLTIQLHEILSYLGQQGIATILVGAHQGIVGGPMISPVDASYLADAVILLRYYEAHGEVRQAISVVKKRGGKHERSIREFKLTTQGIEIGEPLRKFRGVLTGVPVPAEESSHGL
jgi:circadian clock protein KaiC